MKKITMLFLSCATMICFSLSAQSNVNTLPGLDKEIISHQLNPLAGKHKAPEQAAYYVALYDSIYYWQWDTNSVNWFNPGWSRFVNMVYNSHQLIASETYQFYLSSVWTNTTVYNYTYDANNSLTELIDLSWNGSAWVNNYQDVYTYDAKNNELSFTNQSWNGTAWVNNTQYAYTYDA
ncbi:MAG TPA: hypothetical protein VK808_08725, partial [Bacteroidia bacterium]|nr:hypothetical protein [Bacteroidia bacterium]